MIKSEDLKAVRAAYIKYAAKDPDDDDMEWAEFCRKAKLCGLTVLEAMEEIDPDGSVGQQARL